MVYQSLRIINRFWTKLPRGVVIDLLIIGSIYSDEAKGIYVVKYFYYLGNNKAGRTMDQDYLWRRPHMLNLWFLKIYELGRREHM